jgi:ABC-type transport system involved in multi-copper enzyme maturation permease subunit
MVDWERVEQLRSKGWDWDSIAEDPKTHFTPPEGIEDSGKALKALYFSRKSRGQTTKKKKGETKETASQRIKKGLIPAGIVVAILGGIWFGFAMETSLVGVWLVAYPYVLLVAIAGVVLMAIGLILGTARLSEVWKKPVAIGIVLGLVISGGLALFAGSLGVPNLHPPYNEPTGQGWESETPRNSLWTSGDNRPVFFFYGSVGCPYCAASSWAVYVALSQFGTLTGTGSGNSVEDNVPEITLDSSSLSSTYINWDVKEGNDFGSTSDEPGTSLVESAYLNYYNVPPNGGGIPFYVVGGIFIHPGALVNPTTSGLSGLSPQTVQSILNDPSSNQAVYSAIHTGAIYLEAFLYEADVIAGITPPSSVASDGNVMTIVHEIT